MQLKLFEEKIEKEFGGSLNQGRRKLSRPLDPTKPIHFILKARDSADLLENRVYVEEKARSLAVKFGIRIYAVVVNADHVHFIIKISRRDFYNRWIRGLTGILARKMTGLKWKQLPYSRIASWGREYHTLRAYLDDNLDEVKFIEEAERTVKIWIEDLKEKLALTDLS